MNVAGGSPSFGYYHFFIRMGRYRKAIGLAGKGVIGKFARRHASHFEAAGHHHFISGTSQIDKALPVEIAACPHCGHGAQCCPDKRTDRECRVEGLVTNAPVDDVYSDLQLLALSIQLWPDLGFCHEQHAGVGMRG